MLCQSDDLLHYSDYVCLSYLMQAVATVLWHSQLVGLHILVDIINNIFDAIRNSLYDIHVHRANFLSNIWVIWIY
jgi:hypothetical protein